LAAIGGLGEVGMNTMVFRFGSLCVPVDVGIAFAEPNDFGIEEVHPDYRRILVEERRRTGSSRTRTKTTSVR